MKNILRILKSATLVLSFVFLSLVASNDGKDKASHWGRAIYNSKKSLTEHNSHFLWSGKVVTSICQHNDKLNYVLELLDGYH